MLSHAGFMGHGEVKCIIILATLKNKGERMYTFRIFNKIVSNQNSLKYLGCPRDVTRASMYFSAFCKMVSEWNVSKRQSLEKILIINSTL